MPNIIDCDNCGYLNVDTNHGDEFHDMVRDHNLVVKSLTNYWRWKAEDKPEFGVVQHYYSDTKQHFVYYPNTNQYSFSIYRGDRWISGTIKVGRRIPRVTITNPNRPLYEVTS